MGLLRGGEDFGAVFVAFHVKQLEGVGDLPGGVFAAGVVAGLGVEQDGNGEAGLTVAMNEAFGAGQAEKVVGAVLAMVDALAGVEGLFAFAALDAPGVGFGEENMPMVEADVHVGFAVEDGAVGEVAGHGLGVWGIMRRLPRASRR